MEKIKKTDTHSPGPINLDQDQLEELSKLIDNLKKEITYPQTQKGAESTGVKTSDR